MIRVFYENVVKINIFGIGISNLNNYNRYMQLLKVKICVNMYIKKFKKNKYNIEYFNLFIFKCMNEKKIIIRIKIGNNVRR